MHRPSARTLLIVLAAAALTAGACSSGGGGGTVELTDGTKATAASTSRTIDAGSVRFDLRYDSKLGTTSTVVTGDGSFDFKSQLGQMSIKVGEQATQLIVTEDTFYGKLPGLLAQGPKPWLSFPRKGGGAAVGGLDQLVKLADPRESLGRLPLASQMTRVGTENVRGVSTVHFHGLVDLSDAAVNKLPEADRADVRQFRDGLGAQSHPIDVWLDDHGRVRRFESSLAGDEAGQQVNVLTHIELFGFGDKVSVKVPPPSQVQDGSTFGGLGG